MKNLTIQEFLNNNPQNQKLVDLVGQSSKYQFQIQTYHGYEIEIPVYVGGQGKNPRNWVEIQEAAASLETLIKAEIDRLVSTEKVEAIQNEKKLERKRKIIATYTIFALVAIGGFASYANISNVIHLVGSPSIGEYIAIIPFGFFLSFCFAYFALLGEHQKTNTTAVLLGLDVVSHFLVAKGVLSFDNYIVTITYVVYYAAQLVISMNAVAKLSKNANFMVAFFGEE
jgi:hypothetical protein